MKRVIALLIAALLAASALTGSLAATYSSKDIVKQAQQALNDAGYNCGTPDGIAGKKTAAAINQYQTDNGLEVTGVVDDALLESLGIEVPQAEEPESEPEETADDSSGGEAAQVEAEEVVPKDLVKILGGFPKNIADYPKSYKLALLPYIYENWDRDAMLEELRQTQSVTVTAPDFGDCYGGNITVSTEDGYENVSLDAKRSKDDIALTISEGAIPDEVDYFSLSISGMNASCHYEANTGMNEIDRWDQQVFGGSNYRQEGYNPVVTMMVSNIDYTPERYMAMNLSYDEDGYFVDMLDRQQQEDGSYGEDHYYARYDASGQRLWMAGNTLSFDEAGYEAKSAILDKAKEAKDEQILNALEGGEALSEQEKLYDPARFAATWWTEYYGELESMDWGDTVDWETLSYQLRTVLMPDMDSIDIDVERGEGYQDIGNRMFGMSIDWRRVDGAFIRPSYISFRATVPAGGDNFLDILTYGGLRHFLNVGVRAYGGSDETLDEIMEVFAECLLGDGSIDLDELENGILYQDEAFILDVDEYGDEDEDRQVRFTLQSVNNAEKITLSGDDVPALPESISKEFGEIPETVGELLERFDCGFLPEAYETLQPVTLGKNLKGSGKAVIPGAAGVMTLSEPAALHYLDINNEDQYIGMSSEVVDGQLVITLNDALPDAQYLMYSEYYFWCDYRGKNIYVFSWGENNNIVQFELRPTTEGLDAIYWIRYSNGKWSVSVENYAFEAHCSWNVSYDEAGNIENKEYVEYPNF